jgi:hypothetical protein
MAAAAVADKAAESFVKIRTGKQLLVRWPFVSRHQSDVVGEWSDRVLPPRRERPPATRLVSAHGIALRFYLIALFVAQSRSVGERPGNTLPLNDRDADVSWVDLVATPAERGKGTNVVVSVRDQNVRRVQQALRRLADEEVQLVTLPDRAKPVGTYEGFILLHEHGAPYGSAEEGDESARERNERYTVPGERTRELLRLPPGLFRNGWINVLDDTEITLLLMITALHARYGVDRQVYLDGESRLLQFGIGRDAYQAHHLLERFGLIDVEVDAARHLLDGRSVTGFAKGIRPKPHRFRLLPDGFDRPAIATVREAVENRLNGRIAADPGIAS